ncbi:MAG: DUF4384 domain-containing protein [Treponema sp.]|nr:DUF4384 domain-containing protein [Treponema sp.]
MTALISCLLGIAGCASQDVSAPSGAAQGQNGTETVYSADSLTLDEAVSGIAAWFIGRLPVGAATAIVSFEAETGRLGDYLFEEFWDRFEDAHKFIMVDRRNLDRIRAEMNYQMSGEVSDESARSIGRQYGARYIVYGKMIALGGEYRLTVYATDVETASGSQRALTVRPDGRLASLLVVSPDDEVDRAVETLGRSLTGKTTIAVGRISYAGTQSVSSLSAWLKNGITAGALKRQDKFAVASDGESAAFAAAARGLLVESPAADSSVEAVVVGSFSPVDDDAEVSLRLVSTGGNGAVLGSARFVIPAQELERRRLSLLPAKDTAVISRAEFEAKQKAVDPYAGRNNRFVFTVTPDDLDGVYYDGEYMTMRLYSGGDGYFRIVQVDVNGTAQVIYPLAAGDNNVIRAGETRRIPDNTRYRMGAPSGEEYILVAVYDRPFVPGTGGGGPVSESAITRGLLVESGEPSGGADKGGQISPVATAKFSYTILPR